MDSSNTPAAQGARFVERPTQIIVPDAFLFGAVPLALAGVSGFLGWTALAWVFLGLTLFVFAFFRNPERALPGDDRTVVSAADGRVLEVAEIEDEDGERVLRIAVFLSVFNVHVNRAPLAGRVESVKHVQGKYLAAFDPRIDKENARCVLTLRTTRGERVRVIQIVGLIARRIVCHAQEGEWLERGMRYGLIRFGSRTDVILPRTAVPQVKKGEKVRGGSTVLATLPEVV